MLEEEKPAEEEEAADVFNIHNAGEDKDKRAIEIITPAAVAKHKRGTDSGTGDRDSKFSSWNFQFDRVFGRVPPPCTAPRHIAPVIRSPPPCPAPTLVVSAAVSAVAWWLQACGRPGRGVR